MVCCVVASLIGKFRTYWLAPIKYRNCNFFFFFLMERITLILKTIEDKNPYRLLDPERQMSDRVT